MRRTDEMILPSRSGALRYSGKTMSPPISVGPLYEYPMRKSVW